MSGTDNTDVNSSKILLHLNRIDKKLDFIMDYMKKQNTSSYLTREVDSVFLNFFPMKDISALQNVEDILKDEENKSKLVSIQI